MRTGLKISFDESILIAFVIAMLLVGYLGYLSLKGVDKLEQTARQVERSQVVMERLQTMRGEMEHAATGVRGYILTKNAGYLRAYDEACAALPNNFQRLEDLSDPNSKRQKDLAALQDLSKQYLDTLGRLIAAQNQQPPAPVADTLDESDDLLWQVGSYIRAMQADEQLLLASRTQGSTKSSNLEKLTLGIGSLSAIWIILVSIFFLAGEMRSRQKLQLALAAEAVLLKEVNKELEAFSYSVSHDLRAPLRHIDGFVQLLQKSPAIQAEEKTRQKLDVISGAARQMGMLIDDLLVFSRTGRTEMHTAVVDMAELVESSRQEVMLEAGTRRIEWVIGPMPKVEGDPRLLRMVWTNLLANAVKYTRPREEARIEVSAREEKEETVFSIRDNGVGFDPRYKEKLFGVFQRLHRQEDFEGTGIGLANVQRIVHRHGGKVSAEGEIGSGAIFHFTLLSVKQRTTTLP